MSAGERPTVTEVADAADVSRRTAYRYFPSQRKLLSDAALDGLRPIMERAIEVAAPGTGTDDAETRIDAMVKSMQQLAI